MTADIPTPLVDAVEFEPCDGLLIVESDFARKLERALGVAKARLEAITNTWDANSGRLREATGDSVRFQYVDETIEAGKQALNEIEELMKP